MKIPVTVILLFCCIRVNAQTVKADSTVQVLKTYLEKNIRYPAVARVNNVQGKMVITFKLNNEKRISEIQIVKPLFKECDLAVVKAMRQYPNALLLPPAEYTIGLQFIIHDGEKPDSTIIPFDKSIYKNFLFEVDMTGYAAERKVQIVY